MFREIRTREKLYCYGYQSNASDYDPDRRIDPDKLIEPDKERRMFDPDRRIDPDKLIE